MKSYLIRIHPAVWYLTPYKNTINGRDGFGEDISLINIVVTSFLCFTFERMTESKAIAAPETKPPTLDELLGTNGPDTLN